MSLETRKKEINNKFYRVVVMSDYEGKGHENCVHWPPLMVVLFPVPVISIFLVG